MRPESEDRGVKHAGEEDHGHHQHHNGSTMQGFLVHMSQNIEPKP